MTTQSPDPGDGPPPPPSLRRRHLLGGVAALTPVLASGCATRGRTAASSAEPGHGPAPAPAAPAAAVAADTVAVEGARQGGVDRPAQPQQQLALAVFGVPRAERVELRRLLAGLGRRVGSLHSGGDPLLGGLPPGDLTVTVGVGPRLVRVAGGTLPGADALPSFARDDVADEARDGDLLLQICATDPQTVVLAERALRDWLTARAVRPRWSQHAFRPPARTPGPVRNLLGFLDGISVPRTPGEMAREVWLPGPAAVRDATIAVVRRLRLDVTRFAALSVPEQERVIGRRRADGAPLSGGGPDAPVDLGAKSAVGRYLLPAMAHARRAHPAETGSGLMLRRGYSYAGSPDDQGLLFVSFQRELRTFTQTQRRLDDGDALMPFATATASGTFLVLPGFSADRPLGATLFG
ncbi:Dyp-type peroxidase [Streptomyces sp. NPDC005573]|uniref:Dyp-type peroxidase n=1 Tax=unclassified Streptomyces TaxID=2593676 RepID=UPI0033B4E34F